MAVIDKLAAALENKYRIERELGAGGMAVVFLARDLRHDRNVALKLLRPELSAILGGDRFLAEIRTTANLQHPHILPLHDSGEVDGLVYYVMPFVEGESLRDRLNREKQLPVEDAVRIAREVASALDYAHRRGVVHRDIKPENILLHDSQAMVADFGIALAAARSDGSTRMTETGMSLGTPQYMAPEQAMGDRDITARADIYALGCVLYEMLVGEPPFAGPTPQAIVARMLTEQPRGLTVQRQTVPAHVEVATLKALQRLPADRFASAAQLANALGSSAFVAPGVNPVVTTAATTSDATWRRILPIAAAIVLTAVVTSIAWRAMAPVPAPQPVARFTLPISSQGAGAGLMGITRKAIAISPDGGDIVFAMPYGLLRRSLSEGVFKPIPGSESRVVGVSNPAFSPDGKSVVYWSGGAIRIVPVTGGSATTVTSAVNPIGMHWSEGGIVFATDNDIMRVSPDGGRPELLIDLPTGHSPMAPQMLPGGTDLLFTLAQGSSADRWERAQIFVQRLGTNERTLVIDGGSDALYVPTGHVLYALGGSLLAVPFDLRSRTVTGPAQPVVEGVRRGPVGLNGTAHYAAANNGTLAHIVGPATFEASSLDLALTTRGGSTELLDLPSARYAYPRVSPDGKRVAVGTEDGQEAIVWVYHFDRSSAIRRLTLGGRDRFPIWSADGQWIAYQSTRDGDAGIFRQRADGSGPAERLTRADSGATHIPDSWSPADDVFLFSITRRDTTTLWLHSLASKASTPFGDVQSVGNQVAATFSPDGKWVAYSVGSGEQSGSVENFVFVQPFPATGARYQISQTGENGHHAMWSRDQKELFYVPLVGQFVARSIATTPSFTFGNPVAVPRSFPVAAPVTPRTFDILPDGQVIGVVARGTVADSRDATAAAPPNATPEVTVILNWFEELKSKVRPR